MTVLHLVRHGRPEVKPRVPPHEWRLSAEARDGLLALWESGVLPSGACWSSSPEPKALETARFLADGAIVTVHGFREQVRPAGWLDSELDYRDAVRTAFDDPQSSALPGWEPLDRTRTRVAAAVRHLVDSSCPQSPLVATGHGTAWTLLVSELTACPPDLDAWRRMLMPDHCALDLNAGTVMSRWGSWA
jgi:broad specificity phosphatase PhoE